MILLQGEGISPGVVSGPLRFFRRVSGQAIRRSGSGPEEERARLTQAQSQAAEQLEILAKQCCAEGRDEAAALLDTYALLVRDEDYCGRILAILDREQCSAEYAVQQAGAQFSARFAHMDDPYMQARAADIQDMTRRLLNALTGVSESGFALDAPAILAADDLAPSELLRLDRTNLLGLVMQGGSGSSHTAILARTMEIPAVCSLGAALRREYEGQTVLLDGERGALCLEPDAPALQSFRDRQAQEHQKKSLTEAMRGQEDVTLDGQRLCLCCNINAPEEVSAVRSGDGQGIGLFRSEFLYLAADHCPTEEEQFQAYRSVAAAMNGKRVVIRTLDAGADKQADCLHLPQEENPALGLRGIRLCLARPELFRTQLRAIYRASAYGSVSILFPMIASVWEVRECRRLCESVMAELTAEGRPFDPHMEIGIMLETPASIFMAPNLAKLVDFFSVGTNDLAQYTLACDRHGNSLGRFYDPRHPAVLRAVKLAADAAHGAGIPVAICGDLGADPSLLPTFLAMGIDELSVPPASVLPLRAVLRSCTTQSCTLERLEG
ncbi:MAG: phosphoenolpyruvate--protein phosphotransferase [Clostridiales bacterium]|nr:phosphoenolpyruvate--protein phosphotransferase [Clostridiales bacterium]